MIKIANLSLVLLVLLVLAISRPVLGNGRLPDSFQYYDSAALLNAYSQEESGILETMLPNRNYFIEFPRGGHSSNSESSRRLAPSCADGSDYSFLFRRGSDKNFKKLIVEMEGGPACWRMDEGKCGCGKHARQTPWYDYYKNNDQDYNESEKALPRLGSCSGVVPEFVTKLQSLLFRNVTDDVPLSQRPARSGDGETTSWWESLRDHDTDSIQDWSYILLPHCSMDWHLGYQTKARWSGCNEADSSNGTTLGWWYREERIVHRGKANMLAVVDWVVNQFGRTSLDAMVTFAGGKIGGCDFNDPEYTSSFAPALFATEIAQKLDLNRSSMLVLLEGATMLNKNLPHNFGLWKPWNADVLTNGWLIDALEEVVANSPDAVDFAWIASGPHEESINKVREKEALETMSTQKPGQFHVYYAPQIDSNETLGSCPRFAFPDDDCHDDFSFFLKDTVSHMSWKTDILQEETSKSMYDLASDTVDTTSLNSGGSARLSFLSIAVLMLGLLVLVLLLYFLIKTYRLRHELPKPLSPNELWLRALTHYPFCFLVASVALPVTLSLIAFARAGYRIDVNLDFDTYLDISSDLDILANNYAMAQQYQENSYLEAKAGCRNFGGSEVFKPGYYDDPDRRLVDNDHVEKETRQLPAFNMSRLLDGEQDSTLDRYIGATITVVYQNPNGGNVFTPAVLDSVYDFEQSVREYPGYRSFCRKLQENNCAPFDSLVMRYLYPAGYLVEDIEAVLGAFATSGDVDQYFGPENRQSNITKTFMYFEGKEGALHDFLEDLFHDLLWERDQSNYYPDMIYTWENGHLLQLEANEALNHDTLWSIGSLIVIGMMIFLKVQDIVVFFFGMLGLLLAFTTSYYWCAMHFGVQVITLLHVSGLFVMLGIGADDIFLMIDSYEHAKVELAKGSNQNGRNDVDENSAGRDLERIRSRMLWAYSTAGGMMLVSSVTAAVCFFSNAFGVLLVIQEFGIYMGMVVLVNFFHVMTILPSAILVNEIYVKPWKARLVANFTAFLGSKYGEDSHDIAIPGTRQPNQGEMELSKKRSSDKLPVNDESITSESKKEAERMIPRPTPRLQESMQAVKEAPAQISETRFMSRMDSWLLDRYSPFLTRRHVSALVICSLFASLLGIFGVLNLEFSDGSIVLFSNAYNQGRLTSIKKKYFVSADAMRVSGGEDIAGGVGIGTAPVLSPTFGENSEDDIPGSTGSEGSGPPGEDSSGGGDVSGGGEPSGGIGGSNAGGAFDTSKEDDNVAGGNGSVGSGGNDVPTPTTSLSGSPGPVSPSVSAKESRINVKLIWGIDPNTKADNNPWLIETKSDEDHLKNRNGTALLDGVVSGLDLSAPETQQWLLAVVLAVKQDDTLNVVKDEATWIELLYDFSMKQDGGFPVPRALFVSYIEMLKLRDSGFADLVRDEIGTLQPGLAGETYFSSVTFQSEEFASLTTFAKWTTFADRMNKLSPSGFSPMVAQSDLFWNEARAAETIDATINTWLIANSLCALIILLFALNLILCLMVMVTILLMFFCISGLLFAVFGLQLGPVQALGISVFIGLSANYSLHVVHAYHRSGSDNRQNKVKDAVFITGSPICASAFSTIGGCVFLFGCRTAPLVELGILICCVTAMALVYSMIFLLAWLLRIGPLPYEGENSDLQGVHKWDIYELYYKFSRCRPISDNVDETNHKNDREAQSNPEGGDHLSINVSSYEETRLESDPEVPLSDI